MTFPVKTWATDDVLTAADVNTYLRDTINILNQRTSPSTAIVATSENQTSSTFGDLATTGPAVTLTTGTMALVILYSMLTNDTTGDGSAMGFAVSGASTVAVTDTYSLAHENSTAGKQLRMSATFLVTGLTAGSNTFTAKYRRITGGTATFADRKITVIPLGA